MLMKTVLTLIIISFFVILIAQEDNTLVLGDSKLYFSIGSTINSKYYTKEYSGYTKTLKSYHFKKNEELGNKIPPSFIKISLPDSLVGDNLKIKKGFYATKVDTILSAPFVIKNFELDYWCGNGRTIIDFTVPDSLNHNDQNLFIMAKSDESLKNIIPFNPKVCTDSKTSSVILEFIYDFFYKNRDELKRQLSYEYSIDDSLSIDELKKIMPMLYDFSIFEIERNCYLTVGYSKWYIYPRFFALVFPNERKVELKINSRLFRSFKINDDYFFYCQSFIPFTGAQIYSIYLFKEGKLKRIFSEGAFAM